MFRKAVMPTQDSSERFLDKPILVTGANGLAGPYMCELLRTAGFDVCSLGRRPVSVGPSINGDLARPELIHIEGQFGFLVHLAPLWLLPRNLGVFAKAGIHRIIAFGSTSSHSKSSSQYSADRKLAARLSGAEEGIREQCVDLGITWTILRPTMIYGFGRDSNVMSIARLIARLGFFPMAGAGTGLRQPIHVLDVVHAAYRSLMEPATAGVAYDIGGGECLTYKAMVNRIFEGLQRKPRIVHLPQRLYAALLTLATKLNLIKEFSPGAAARMNKDLDFDISDARRDFDFQPARFLTDPERDLPL